jgi:hypothetical protein
MTKMTEKEWAEDFKEFVTTQSVPVSEELSSQILSRIHKAMHPSAWLIFAKLFGIHSIVGTLSLAVCNQFGINILNTHFSLSDYFMKFGHSVCMTLCGFIFIGLSVSFAFALLNREELVVFRKNSFIQIFSLSLFSLVAFLAFGAEVILSIGALWLTGALLGGFLPLLIYNLGHLEA